MRWQLIRWRWPHRSRGLMVVAGAGIIVNSEGRGKATTDDRLVVAAETAAAAALLMR